MGGGDSKDCVKSRSAFLDMGHYAPISERINEMVKNLSTPHCVIVDAGCGEGYYTTAIAKSNPCASIYGMDISKPAIEQGAKRAKRDGIANSFFAVSSIFTLPFSDESVDIITSIFAPCPEEEFLRTLKKGGYLIIAAAGKEHLMGLKKAIYENVYENEARADLPTGSGFQLVEKNTLSYSIDLSSQKEIADLFSMTPYFYRTSQQDKDKLLKLSTLNTKVEIDLSIYRKN